MSRYIDPVSFLRRNFHFAVADASNDFAKVGFQIYLELKQAGFHVSPVHPTERTIQGDLSFPNLQQMRPFPDVVIITVPLHQDKNRGMQVLREMRDFGIFRAWIEPGCENSEMAQFAEDYKLDLITGFSLCEELRKLPEKSVQN